MCSSKSKLQEQSSSINGRPVLQPNCIHHRAPLLERRNSIPLINNSSSQTQSNTTTAADCSSKVLKPLTLPRIQQLSDALLIKTTIIDDQPNPLAATTPPPNINKSLLNKPMSFKYTTSSSIGDAPAGSIAAARREQVAILQEQRKMRIAHYGRTTKSSPVCVKLHLPPDNIHDHQHSSLAQQEKRCTFITPNSGQYMTWIFLFLTSFHNYFCIIYINLSYYSTS